MYPLTLITCQYQIKSKLLVLRAVKTTINDQNMATYLVLYLGYTNLWCGSSTPLTRSPSPVQMGYKRVALHTIHHVTPGDLGLTIMRALILWELIYHPKCKFEFWEKCRLRQLPCKLCINIAVDNTILIPTFRTYCLLELANGISKQTTGFMWLSPFTGSLYDCVAINPALICC